MRKWEQFIDGLSKFGMKGGFKPGLKRIETLLQYIGNPHHSFKVIHIGGTNGKGSTSAFMASILKELGLKVGLYTSPHLEDFRERIQINGNLIPHEDLDFMVSQIEPVYHRILQEKELGRPTYFEVVTAIALGYFARENIDIAVVEVGLGGRLDATNVVQPLVSIITNVSLEHTAILGNDIALIAREKAGIIKERVPVITGAGQKEALRVIEEKAREKNAPLFILNREIKLELLDSGFYGSLFRLKIPGQDFKNYRVSIPGSYQARNAALALTAVNILADSLQVDIDKREFEKRVLVGLEGARWPGRLELINSSPDVILDGAHNLEAMQELARFLSENKKEYNKLFLVFGVLGDKDVKGMLGTVSSITDYLILTRNNYFRARDPKEILQETKGMFKKVEVVPAEDQAVRRALDLAGANDLICITGSLYTVGSVRKIFV